MRPPNPNSTRVLLTAALLMAAAGCKTPAEPNAADKRAMLTATAQQVVIPTLDQFEQEASALAAGTEALVAAQGGDTASAQDAARAAFIAALKTWERAELFGFGPSANQGRFVGALSLRDGIYSWPTVNPCQVDSALVKQTYSDPAAFGASLVTIRGLATIERLLFVDGATNACPADATINGSGSWSALSAQELARRRAEYAAAAAVQVKDEASRLAGEWRSSFGATLSSAGTSGSPYSEAQAAVSEVFAGLLYLDRAVKDSKLAIPAGIDPQCGKQSCPELAEAVASAQSQQALVQNLLAAQALFRGSFDAPGSGFDKLLAGRGAQALADDVDGKLAAALAKARALTGPVDVLVVSQPQQVAELHTALRELDDLLKSQVVSTLDLKVPDMGAGDND